MIENRFEQYSFGMIYPQVVLQKNLKAGVFCEKF